MNTSRSASLSTSMKPTPHPRYGPSVAARPERKLASTNSPALIAVQRGVVLREVRLHQIEPSVAVVVTNVHAHPGLLAAVSAHREPGLQGALAERAIPAVLEEQVRRGIVRHEDIQPPVIVEIAEDDAEAVVSRINDARTPGDVREYALAIVAIQGVWLSRKRARAAERVDVHEPAAFALPAHRHVPGDKSHVVRDVEVNVPVAIVVAECAAGAPARILRLACGGERAAVDIAPQHVGSERGDIHILEAV